VTTLAIVGLIWALSCFAFGVGFVLGKLLADARWRENAEQPEMMESAGAFYKVLSEGKARSAIAWEKLGENKGFW